MIGVGIAGAGFFAAQHAQAMAAVPGVRIVAAAAGDAAGSAAFAAAYGGRACADWRELLDDPAVDVVLVTTPHHLHAPIAIAAAQAGRHVLVEKPMAPTLTECVAMHRAAAAAGVHLLVGQISRFSLTGLRARELLTQGSLGRPLWGRSAMLKRWMESNRRPWHLARETGGGMLLTAGIHALDRLVWLMDAPVASVAAMAGNLFHDQKVPDVEQVLLRFAGGELGTLSSVGYRDATMVNDTEIACEGGLLRLNTETGLSIGREGRWTEVPGAAEPAWMLRALEREWLAMLAAIGGTAALPVSAAQAGELVACIEAAGVAAAERREVEVVGWPKG